MGLCMRVTTYAWDICSDFTQTEVFPKLWQISVREVIDIPLDEFALTSETS